MPNEVNSGGGEFSRDGLGERPESGLVRKLKTMQGELGAGLDEGLGPSTHLGAVSSRSGGRRWRRRPRGASLPSLGGGLAERGAARGSRAEGRGSRSAERWVQKRRRGAAPGGRAGTRPGAGSCRRLLAAPPSHPHPSLPAPPPGSPPASCTASYSRAAAAAPGSKSRRRILLGL